MPSPIPVIPSSSRRYSAFIKALYLREEEGITGIGEGIAIPHGKSSVVAKTAIAIGRNLDGIEWETFDDKPVRVVIMLADRTGHLWPGMLLHSANNLLVLAMG